MNQYDRMWSAIFASPFGTVYVGEVYWLARQVEEELTQVFDDTPPPARQGAEYIRVDYALHRRILTVLLAAARIRALVLARRRGESRRQEEVHARRTAALAQLLDGIVLAPVLNGAARNSIEHFDEYLDGTAIKSYLGVIPRPTLFAVDMVVSSRRLLEGFKVGGERPITYFIRAYVADEHIFSNCERELRLEPLRECCAAIRARLESLVHSDASGERGLPMLVVTDASFGDGGS
jgi:hypothetical protein